MSLFQLGPEFGQGLGGKYASNAEALGYDLPVPKPAQGKMVDAVRAAVAVMNRAGSSADIMGSPGASLLPSEVCKSLCQTDKLLRAAGKVALDRPNAVGPVRTVRLGLLIDDWLRLKETLILASFAQQAGVQEAMAFNPRAKAMAEEIYQATSGTGPQAIAAAKNFPWKRVFIGVGVFIAGIVGWVIYKAYKKAPEPQQTPLQEHLPPQNLPSLPPPG